jgi:hypothetical protein
MSFQFANYATGRLAAILDAAESTVTIQSGGALFPVASGSNVFQAVLEDVDGNIEVVTVTNHALDADVFTVARAQEDTIALTFAAGSVFELRLTRDILRNFLQRSGGTLTGDIDADGNDILNVGLVAPVIQGGILQGVTIRDADNDPATEIFIPIGGQPTIGGNVILTTANLDDITNIGGIAVADIVQQTRQVNTAANSGLAGGGDLSANRNLVLAPNNLVSLSDTPAYNDQFAVYDDSDTAPKKVAAETAYGIAVRTLTANHILERSDAALLMEFDAVADLTLTVPPNSSVAFPVGVMIPVRRRGTGNVTFVAGSGVTIEAPGAFSKISTRYGMAMLIKRGTNLWALEGRLGT